eukprot:1159929-Pelagomonas_calceolata.AAC.18
MHKHTHARAHTHTCPQIYYCLRNGWVDSARRAAERAHDAIVSARLGEGGFKAALDEWARHGGRVSERWVAARVGSRKGVCSRKLLCLT